jgi:outer membrane receptor protein involved in Fe transport
VSVAADWDVPGVQGLSLNGRCVSRPSTWTTPTPCAPGWTRLDFGARYAMQVAGKPVVLRASIENLANRRYWLTTTVSSSYPTPWSARRAPSRCLRPSTSDTRQRFSGPALPPPPAAQGPRSFFS